MVDIERGLMVAKNHTPMWSVYILRCQTTDRLYTGISKDVSKRLATHNAGRGAKFTRSSGPWLLAYSRAVSEDVGPALVEERRIKKLSRSKKLELIQSSS